MRERCKHCTEDNHGPMVLSLVDHFGDKAQNCPFCGRYIGRNDYHKKEKPEIINRDDNIIGNKEERHPAYAQMSFSRQSGGYSNLYGSAIKHQDTISMTISKSVKISSKYNERYYAGGIPLIEVRMSQSQFAQLITTMNQGSGVPVTLEQLRGKALPKCEEKTISETANDGLNEKMNKFADNISIGRDRVNEILRKKGAILKSERSEIKSIYDSLMMDLRSNLPFLHKCMIEAYDKTVMSAKADIEAFYDNAIKRMGIEAMNTKQIEDIK